jgi:hypothetical protein
MVREGCPALLNMTISGCKITIDRSGTVLFLAGREVRIMLRKKLTNNVSTAARILADILVLIAVALVVVSFVESAFAAVPLQGSRTNTLRGEIVAVDNVGYVTVLTVRSAQIGPFPNNELNIFTNQNTMVKICKEREPARDINVGSNATITYHEEGRVAVANKILERC